MHTFVITIISVTIFTAFLVLNLQLLTELVKQLMGIFTILLRKFMQRHWRPSWRKTNSALQNDVDAAKIPIQNRLRRSSHWMYLIFIIETLLVGIPVYELRAAANLWGFISHLDAKAAASKARPPPPPPYLAVGGKLTLIRMRMRSSAVQRYLNLDVVYGSRHIKS
jgi:hypothetical protein